MIQATILLSGIILLSLLIIFLIPKPWKRKETILMKDGQHEQVQLIIMGREIRVLMQNTKTLAQNLLFLLNKSFYAQNIKEAQIFITRAKKEARQLKRLYKEYKQLKLSIN